MPFSDYENLAQCVAKNQDKDDPEAYCSALKKEAEAKGDGYEDRRSLDEKESEEKGYNHPDFDKGQARSLGAGKSFKFYTDGMSFTTVGTKGDKTYYVTGYISTGDVDRYNEVVSDKAMDEMLDQLKGGNIKLDVEHSTFTGENEIPIGRIVEAKIDSKGLWVKCILNKNHGKFNEVWNSIKEGFLDAFSIAYKVLDVAEEFADGITKTILKSIELLNVAITGNPVNPNATMTGSFAKSLKAYAKYKSEEDKKMSDEPKIEEPVAEKPAEEKPAEPEAKPEEKVEEKPAEEKPAEEPAEPKEEPEAPKAEEPEVAPLDTIKSLKEENKEIKAELKAMKEEMNKPVLKSLSEEMPKPKNEVVTKSPFQMIQ